MCEKEQKGWTSVEHSRQLIDAGLDILTSDMHYYKHTTPIYESFGWHISADNPNNENWILNNYNHGKIIPAWSLGQLIAIVKEAKYIADWEEMFNRLAISPIESTVLLVIYLLREGYIKKNTTP